MRDPRLADCRPDAHRRNCPVPCSRERGVLFLTIGLIFTALFCFVALLVPHAFTGLGELQDHLAVAGNLIYFSFITLTSVGCGDIVSLHPYARSLANVEAIVGPAVSRDPTGLARDSRAGASAEPIASPLFCEHRRSRIGRRRR